MEEPIIAFNDSAEQCAYLRRGPGLVLSQEGLVNDLVFQVNRHRREQGYAIPDRIGLQLGVSLEVWWAIHFNEALLKSRTLALELQFFDERAMNAEGNFSEVSLGDKEMPFKAFVKTFLMKK